MKNLIETYSFILERISFYFQNESKCWHLNNLNAIGVDYHQTPIDFIYNKLKIIENEISLKGKRFLDVGSGVGHICAVAKIFGCEPEGIEINPVLLRISQILYPDIKIHHQNILSFEDYYNYDVIFYYIPFHDIKLEDWLVKKIENDSKIESYIIIHDARGVEKDNRFIWVDKDDNKKQVWKKISN